VISVTEDPNVIRQVLSLGVMGYIPKTSTADITNSAIRLVLSGGIYMPPHMLKSISNKDFEKMSTHQQAKKTLQTGLTGRQLEVLELVSVGLSNKAIGKELGLAENTVKMHASRLYKTLGVENRTEAVAKLSKLKAEHENQR
jgi:DNA-binding NarL/FixJ family response regulator